MRVGLKIWIQLTVSLRLYRVGVVVIRNAVSHMVASEMREELRSLGRKAFELKESHNHAEITMPDRSIWRGSGVEVCQSISGHFHKFTTQSSTKVCSRQHHLTNLSKEESPRLRSFTEFMKSDAVQMFLSTLAGACDPPDDCNLSQLPKVPNAKIGEVSHDLFWQHKGDYMSTNRGSKPGRLLSATYHLSDDKFRAVSCVSPELACIAASCKQISIKSWHKYLVQDARWRGCLEG